MRSSSKSGYPDGQKQADGLPVLIEVTFRYTKTGWRLSDCLNLIQIKWLKDNDDLLFRNAYKFISTLEYINHKLTGVCASDPLNAGITHLFNIT